jgi:hypothetical protein
LNERRKFFEIKPVSLDLGDVLVQMISIAIGVVIGFGITSWTEHLRQRALFHDTVGTIVSEIRSNQKGLHVVMKPHAAFVGRLVAALAVSKRSVSLNDVRGLMNSQHAFQTNIPLAIAWQIAQGDQGLVLLPFQDRYDLAWIYQLQSEYYSAEQRYQNSALSFREVADGNYYIQIVDLANQLSAVVSNERQLDEAYTQALLESKKDRFR